MRNRNLIHRTVTIFFILWGLGELIAAFLRPPAGSAADSSRIMNAMAAFVSAGPPPLPARFARISFLELTPGLHLFYTAYILLSIFFGSIIGFYSLLPWWDTFLHFLSGVLFSLVGLILFFSILDDEQAGRRIRPAVPILFALFFTAACGVVWEFYEFTVDSLAGMNMQRWQSELPPALWTSLQNVSNRSNPGLIDTMHDLLAAALGSLMSIPLLLRKIRKSREGPGAI